MHCLVVVVGLYATGPSAEQRVEQKKIMEAFMLCIAALAIVQRTQLIFYRQLLWISVHNCRCEQRIV